METATRDRNVLLGSGDETVNMTVAEHAELIASSINRLVNVKISGRDDLFTALDELQERFEGLILDLREEYNGQV